jgi:hypothetical protein
MDQRVLAQIAQMFRANKLGDPSSAAFDPVLALLTGTYVPKQQFTEEQLFERLAPTMLYAAAEGANSPRAIAASRIKAGEAPWSIENDKELRGNISPKDWSRFVSDLAKESQAVRAKMLDLSLEQDPFEKQGLRGLDAQFTPQDAYKYAPKQFAKIFEGLEEAQAAEDAKLKNIRAEFGGDVVLTKRSDILRKLTDMEKTNPAVIKRAREFSPTNWKKELAKFAKFSAESKMKSGDFDTLVDVGQTAAQKSYLAQKEAVEARTAGTASNKMAQAAKLAEGITGALTSAGLSPTMEDILRNLAVRKTMK